MGNVNHTHMASWQRIIFLILVFMASYYIFLQIQLPSCLNAPSQPIKTTEIIHKPVVRIFDISPSQSHLHIVKSVFIKLGYVIVGDNATKWDILWSHQYPFYALQKSMAYLRPDQKVNHFPGNGLITQKANLVSLGVKGVPKAFVLPSQKELFLNYSQMNLNKLWMQKSNAHRGIKILDVDELDLNIKGAFIQEYISKPFLISDRKFDVGVYVVLTSVDPLRVYIYSGDILLRFCTEKYYPFNATNVESYVVGDDYLPVWEVPALKKFYVDLNFTAKESLNAYLLLQKKNPKKLWSQVAEVVQDMFVKAEGSIAAASYKLGHLRNFFELFRVDFVFDEDLNVFLLEANMSPNLSAEHFPPNRLLYEQVLHNVFNIVGIVHKFPGAIGDRNELEVSNKDIAVFVEECNSEACNSSCKIQKCRVCNFCLTTELTSVAKAAYTEQVNRIKFRRVIPTPMDFKSSTHYRSKPLLQSDMNTFMDRWFKGKCLQDITFCQ